MRRRLLDAPWREAMPSDQFGRMRAILSAPSPVGFEASMTHGVLQPLFSKIIGRDGKNWTTHRFVGNAGLVVDTHPGRDDMLSVMICGHADKIRMQVRHVAKDGKIYIDSDSFLPMTLLGNRVTVFSEAPGEGKYRQIRDATVEALGAIHFASPSAREGKTGIKREQLYLETGVHGEDKRGQIERLGIRAGDPIILDRPIERSVFPNSFAGAYLDNGLGCFAAHEVAALLAAHPVLDNVRVLFAFAAFEEIGRFGSRVLASEFQPDVLLALDVNHDYKNAPNVGSKRMPELEMGAGFSISTGSVTSPHLNSLLQRVALDNDIPFQLDVRGRDTGTDAMASVLAAQDTAAASLGFPIRNMHTVSETAHTGDVLACIHVVHEFLRAAEASSLSKADFRSSHPDLSLAEPLQPEEGGGDD